MKLGIKILTYLFIMWPLCSYSADLGFSAIEKRNYVACGINADYNYLAYKQEGYWKGMDADMCRAVAQAVLQDSESFRLIPVKPDKIGEMLNSGTIDIMLGHQILSPQTEAKLNITPTDVIYYDKIVLGARQFKAKATSLRDYAQEKVCVQKDSMAFEYLKRYDNLYNLRFSFIKFPLLSAVKAAFYLQRCNLVVGDEVFVKSIIKDLHNENTRVLPEEMSMVPVKYYTAGDNNYFNVAMRNIFNALQLTSIEKLNSSNIETFKSDKSSSIQNILGYNPEFWQQLKLNPSWVVEYLNKYGNYSDIIERNLGYGSPLELNTSRNKHYMQGGFLTPTPLL